MIQNQTLICVDDVPRASQWYQRVLGLRSGHGGDDYEMLMNGRRLVMQLHAWDVHHGHELLLGRRSVKSRGNGITLWFHVDDFSAILKRVRGARARVLKRAAVNPNAGHREIWLQDLDGYTVVIAGD